MDERHVPMSDGYDQRMAEFAAEAHPSPDQCIRVLLDLLESVKRDRWEHKGTALNRVLRDYGCRPATSPEAAARKVLTAILENSMNKSAMRKLAQECKASGLEDTLDTILQVECVEEPTTPTKHTEPASPEHDEGFKDPELQSPALSTHSTVLLELVTGEYSHDPREAVAAARKDLRMISQQPVKWATDNLGAINAILSAATRRRVKHSDPEAARADIIRGLKKQLAKA